MIVAAVYLPVWVVPAICLALLWAWIAWDDRRVRARRRRAREAARRERRAAR